MNWLNAAASTLRAGGWYSHPRTCNRRRPRHTHANGRCRVGSGSSSPCVSALKLHLSHPSFYSRSLALPTHLSSLGCKWPCSFPVLQGQPKRCCNMRMKMSAMAGSALLLLLLNAMSIRCTSSPFLPQPSAPTRNKTALTASLLRLRH